MSKDLDPIETNEWLEAINSVIKEEGIERASFIMTKLAKKLNEEGAIPSYNLTTPFRNSIPAKDEASMPGDLFMERRIRSLIRWNALAIVLRANMNDDDLGGHISTFSSAATLYDVGFNYFFKGSEGQLEDLIYYQGHSSPGIYARSFLEGHLSEDDLDNFRREVKKPGLSSYPHPWLMPEYWQFPTVSMGLGPIMGIYQAHIMRYMSARGLVPRDDRKVWVFCGDGEMDEPESKGAIALAGREELENLIFVINCNLQRLDGPVRGNGKIIQELEGSFRGAGWNVIKVVWGRKWDPIMAKDKEGKLQDIMDAVLDGEMQNFKAKGGAYTRENFFAKDPSALEIVKDLTDEDIYKLNRGGHDPYKVYAAYHKAVNSKGAPTVILALTTKGYGVGSREADNTTHQVKKLSMDNIKAFRDKFNIPVTDDEIESIPYVRPADDSPEIQYLKKTRDGLGGPIPRRRNISEVLPSPNDLPFTKLYEGTGERKISTTMAAVRVLTDLLKDKDIGKRIVPIVPDEARTFGMEALFRQVGIYSSAGQNYEPEDADKVMWYKESKEGVMLEEGITEAGAFSAWSALATAYSNYDYPMIPFYLFYSMFGFQRIHDLAWAAGDAQAKGFLIGATSGRTTLNGEGLQHQDGHSHILSSTIPNCLSYDPAFSYEVAVIIKDGIQKMYVDQKNYFYYITTTNENYQHPQMPEDSEDGIIRGMYKLIEADKPVIRLLGSGSILRESINARDILQKYKISAEVWSVTSFNLLRKDGMETERYNQLNPNSKEKKSYVGTCFESNPIPVIASTDYMRSYAEQIRPYIDEDFTVLGTDGFGRSDSREMLREFFEIDANSIVRASAYTLYKNGNLNKDILDKIYKDIGVDSTKINPWEA
ncbi:pyruvate dehydrogenase (acetyl-transferring), homodimeric type [Gammaproteobacteria bacterium]|nr:pyruvate dehydrogenase (acetyl-transferring), homodimeric type [Gammaproteobacteria bacterium]MDA8926131.1 pyruvate dehydrogenase (acetyl-transferring), homodimeric type [Gammaproteobacteria bacterium]MDA8997681.1 pyruvate dehydrogenase (acetyl-transferring), homodimeric type [Gammaproteobacteria bacterium]MDA9113700.1 pyruvate dehydrogenase (acetyl-transferring), homodimeric type [Gammaproteobacteria bacterium]MDA9248007.1 pyruvate dehydrogenase (acetyl-transferring), homodimeric type [Gamm